VPAVSGLTLAHAWVPRPASPALPKSAPRPSLISSPVPQVKRPPGPRCSAASPGGPSNAHITGEAIIARLTFNQAPGSCVATSTRSPIRRNNPKVVGEYKFLLCRSCPCQEPPSHVRLCSALPAMPRHSETSRDQPSHSMPAGPSGCPPIPSRQASLAAPCRAQTSLSEPAFPILARCRHVSPTRALPAVPMRGEPNAPLHASTGLQRLAGMP